MKGTMTYRTAMALLTAVLLTLPLRAAAADTVGSAAAGEEVDVKAIVLEHLSDSYWWHIGTFGGRAGDRPLFGRRLALLLLPSPGGRSVVGGIQHCR